MSFLKRLFSSGKSEKPATEEMPQSNTGFQGIFSREGFENRFEEMNLYQDQVVVSVYPFEYAWKVVNNEATFTSLSDRIDAQIGQLPSVQELVNTYLKP